VSPQQTTRSPKYAEAAGEPPYAERSIFRSEALQHYQENQEKVVLPPLVSPRIFIYLWALAGFMMVAGLLLACWPWIEPLVVRVT